MTRDLLRCMFFEVHAWIFVQRTSFRQFIDFCFMMFAEVLMKDLARMWIHVHKIFNCRVSFKLLFSMPFFAEKEL